MDYEERLLRLAWNERPATEITPACRLDPKTVALLHIAATIAIGAAGPSFGAQADAAVAAGASADEIVDVLVAVESIVGAPRIVAAAPHLALALGCRADELT